MDDQADREALAGKLRDLAVKIQSVGSSARLPGLVGDLLIRAFYNGWLSVPFAGAVERALETEQQARRGDGYRRLYPRTTTLEYVVGEVFRVVGPLEPTLPEDLAPFVDRLADMIAAGVGPKGRRRKPNAERYRIIREEKLTPDQICERWGQTAETARKWIERSKRANS